MDQSLLQDAKEHPSSSYMLLKDAENSQLGIFDKPLPCFDCGIGWFSLLLGFVFPFMWYYAPILYFGNYIPERSERGGRASCQCNSCFDIHCSSSSCSCRGSIVVIFCYALIQ